MKEGAGRGGAALAGTDTSAGRGGKVEVTRKHTRNPTANTKMTPAMTPPAAHLISRILTCDCRFFISIPRSHLMIIQQVVRQYMTLLTPMVKALLALPLAWGVSPRTAPEFFSLSCDKGAGEGRGEGGPIWWSIAPALIQMCLLSPALSSILWGRGSSCRGHLMGRCQAAPACLLSGSAGSFGIQRGCQMDPFCLVRRGFATKLASWKRQS